MDSSTVQAGTIEPIMTKIVLTPTTGSTVSFSQARRQYVLLNPSGGLLALTINLPSSPLDGDIVRIGTSQAITTVTMSAGSNTLLSALTSLILGGFCGYIFDSGSGKWFRIA